MDIRTPPDGENDLDRRLRDGLSATAAFLEPLPDVLPPWAHAVRTSRRRYADTPVGTRHRVALAGVLVTGMVTAIVVIVLQLASDHGRPTPVQPASPGPGVSSTATVTASPQPSTPSTSIPPPN